MTSPIFGDFGVTTSAHISFEKASINNIILNHKLVSYLMWTYYNETEKEAISIILAHLASRHAFCCSSRVMSSNSRPENEVPLQSSFSPNTLIRRHMASAVPWSGQDNNIIDNSFNEMVKSLTKFCGIIIHTIKSVRNYLVRNCCLFHIYKKISIQKFPAL